MTFIILSSSLYVSASSLNTYRHANESDGTTVNVMTRESFVTSKVIYASDFGFEENFVGISDIFVSSTGLIYIISSESSYITVLNNDYSLNSRITLIDNGAEVDFTGAQGIYADDSGIYVCDTQNSRVIFAKHDGTVIQYLGLPESDIVPKNLLYQPIRLAKDNDGYTYILSNGCYYGTLVYSPEGEFAGFYGANNVKSTALDTLEYLWDLFTSNETKDAAKEKTLPYAFVDLCFDSEGYMFTCTGTTQTGSKITGQIRKISPSGSNILFQRTKDSKFITSDSVNFVEKRLINRYSGPRRQNIISIDIDEQGFLYALDQTYGLVYVYDRECNLISAFGGGVGKGQIKGTFMKATALALNGSSVLVGDADTGSITVFEITDYGKNLMTAQYNYLNGDYTESEPYWSKVISYDRGNQLAYKGLAMIYYMKGDMSSALEYAKAGLDYNVYDLAYQKVLKDYISDNFVWLFPLILVAIALSIGLFVVKNKKNIVIIKNAKFNTAISVLIHPFDSFSAIKYKKKGSLLIASLITFLFYISSMLNMVGVSFLFTNTSVNNYNILYTIAQTVGLILLWSVVNWLISTLFQGKGSLKEVFIVTAYSITPIIIFNFIRVICSYFLPLSGLSFFNGLYTVVLIFVFFLLCIGMITVHEFSFSKFLLTAIITILSMMLVIFIAFMMIILLQQLWNFIIAIYMEVIYR